ncbi:hypothetical protein EJ02DRAFT_453434 [Clathrospora elynae]|uniref:ASX DEUBAD domain-containing protein n=1 Tax=Clathrospora elynae TaxID=706981 RepID=A0A6A5SU58_9PLEO|nr:hypothetical protein EJ02DRAFT_453434 [Clathrospora elynae]
MSHSEAESFPLSSRPSNLSDFDSAVGSSPPAFHSSPSVAQVEEISTTTTSSRPPVQPQQMPTPEPVSSAVPISNMGAKRAPKQSPKRTREESDNEDDDDAFGTPPPKRPTSRASTKSKPLRLSKNAEKAAVKKTTEKPTPKKPAPKKVAAKKATPAPTPPITRPSRSRKAPDRFEDLQEKPKPKALPVKKGASKVFDPLYVTTNSNSRLGKADVYHMLLEGPAWTSLSAEQQSTLVSMLPQDATNQALLEKINAGQTEGTRPSAFTLSNDCFRTDVAKFKDDLKNGHLAKTWQAAAEQAIIERVAGDYDQWKAEEAESWWGQKSK